MKGGNQTSLNDSFENLDTKIFVTRFSTSHAPRKFTILASCVVSLAWAGPTLSHDVVPVIWTRFESEVDIIIAPDASSVCLQIFVLPEFLNFQNDVR